MFTSLQPLNKSRELFSIPFYSVEAWSAMVILAREMKCFSAIGRGIDNSIELQPKFSGFNLTEEARQALIRFKIIPQDYVKHDARVRRNSFVFVAPNERIFSRFAGSPPCRGMIPPGQRDIAILGEYLMFRNDEVIAWYDADHTEPFVGSALDPVVLQARRSLVDAIPAMLSKFDDEHRQEIQRINDEYEPKIKALEHKKRELNDAAYKTYLVSIEKYRESIVRELSDTVGQKFLDGVFKKCGLM